MKKIQNFMGRCKYCGNEVGIMAESQFEADREVAERCKCGGAETERKKIEMATEVDYLIGKNCADESGFRPLKEEMYLLIHKTAMLAVEGAFESASFKVDGTNIKITSGTKTKIKREYKYEQTGEVM